MLYHNGVFIILLPNSAVVFDDHYLTTPFMLNIIVVIFDTRLKIFLFTIGSWRKISKSEMRGASIFLKDGVWR